MIFIWSICDPPLPLKNQKITNDTGEGDGKLDPSTILSFSCTDKVASFFWLSFAQRGAQ